MVASAVRQQTPATAIRGDCQKPFLFAIDHCFLVKGQGTVMTGTVLQVRASAVTVGLSPGVCYTANTHVLLGCQDIPQLAVKI